MMLPNLPWPKPHSWSSPIFTPLPVNGTLHILTFDLGLSWTPILNPLLSHVNSVFTISLSWLSRPHILWPAKLVSSIFLPHTMSKTDVQAQAQDSSYRMFFLFSLHVQILITFTSGWNARLLPVAFLDVSFHSPSVDFQLCQATCHSGLWL